MYKICLKYVTLFLRLTEMMARLSEHLNVLAEFSRMNEIGETSEKGFKPDSILKYDFDLVCKRIVI
jgi:hypothetical protein